VTPEVTSEVPPEVPSGASSGASSEVSSGVTSAGNDSRHYGAGLDQCSVESGRALARSPLVSFPSKRFVPAIL